MNAEVDVEVDRLLEAASQLITRLRAIEAATDRSAVDLQNDVSAEDIRSYLSATLDRIETLLSKEEA